MNTSVRTRVNLFTLAALVVVIGAVPAVAALEDGLIGYYKMDVTTGQIAPDSSGNGYDGILVGGYQWVPGHDGTALGSPATAPADHVEIPTTGMSAQAGTISVWGYLDEVQPDHTRYFFGHTTDPRWNNRIQIYMQDGDDLDVGLGDTHFLAENIVPMPKQQWQNVIVTWDNGAYVVYVNSEQVAEGTYTGLAELYPTAHIGNDGSTAPYEAFGGMLDEVRVYDRALSAAEVQEIYELPATPRIFAWDPEPADGALDVQFGLLRWKSLDEITRHNVYLGTDPNLTEEDLSGAGVIGTTHFHVTPLEPGETYYWRVDEIEPDGTVHTGNVWEFLVQPATAYYPSPVDGSNTVGPMPDLMWLAGMGVGNQHQVYFSESLEAVEQGAADADKGIFEDPNYAPGALTELTTYYWRVDEVPLFGDIVPGEVWDFTTMGITEDFEMYSDLEGEEIFMTWVDGFDDPMNGSLVGYATSNNGTFGETVIVYDGNQSMPMDYNNVDATYSEATKTFPATRNWTTGGADTLALFIRGQRTNDPAPLYVVIEDSAGRQGKVVHPDETILRNDEWSAWTIPFSAMADDNVNFAAVKSITIGVGDPEGEPSGAQGLFYVDSIGVTKTAPVE